MSDKKITTKRVWGEIGKKRKAIITCSEKRKGLSDEIKILSKEIKALEKQFEALRKEELKDKTARAFLENKDVTDEQILKLLKVNSLIYDKLEDLDADEVARAVNEIVKKKV